MAIQITSKENQVSGTFAGGAILENKPIGFPQDRGTQKPFSNLFYWANAWSDKGGLIGEHPHKMFEIMSFVLEGEIQHYDSKLDGWLTLEKGDTQIIRSGNGITHSERLMPGSRIFQIWFDPNIKESMLKEASYDDYKSEDLDIVKENGIAIKNYVGNGGPVEMDTKGVEIKEYNITESDKHLKLNSSKIHSFYVMDGEMEINNKEVKADDFVVIENESEVDLKVNGKVRLFSVAVSQKLSYKTYLELVNN